MSYLGVSFQFCLATGCQSQSIDEAPCHVTLLLKVGIHPKMVSERLGHANIGITLDTYSHILPGLQERAAERFGEMLEARAVAEDVSKMLAKEPSSDSAGR